MYLLLQNLIEINNENPFVQNTYTLATELI